jgi:Pyruvate/2-oxoacid:ferredoxin oxidoreductase gamma subunit
VDIPLQNWEDAIRKLLPAKFTDMNIKAFRTGAKA